MSHSIALYRFRDPDMIYPMSEQLAAYFPERPDVLLGIYELLLNAVEHGNLSIPPETKMELLRNGSFFEEMKQRAKRPEYMDKYVEIDVMRHEESIFLTIRDHGIGFNWREQLLRFPDSKSIRGRGLMIANKCGFDALIFNQQGNCVTCIVNKTAMVDRAA